MTRQELLRKFINDIDNWSLDVFNQRHKDDIVTKKNLNRWLAELRPLYYSGMLALNQRTAMDKLSAVGIGAKQFEEAYRQHVTALSAVDRTRAGMLQRTLQARFKKGWKDFYESYDEMIANYSSKSLREIQKIFVKSAKADALRFVEKTQPGRKPREWQPKHYASMYARTRSSEVADTLMLADMQRQGMKIVQISEQNTITPLCTLHEGKYYSLDGSGGLPKLPYYPPFHPNCRHLMLAVPPEKIAEYKRHNAKLDRQIKAKSAEFTDGEWRTIRRQQAWLIQNHAV